MPLVGQWLLVGWRCLSMAVGPACCCWSFVDRVEVKWTHFNWTTCMLIHLKALNSSSVLCLNCIYFHQLWPGVGTFTIWLLQSKWFHSCDPMLCTEKVQSLINVNWLWYWPCLPCQGLVLGFVLKISCVAYALLHWHFDMPHFTSLQ